MAKGGLVGLAGARFALLDDNGTIIKGAQGIGDSSTGIYTVSAKADLGMASANITGLAPTLTDVFGNNVKVDTSVGKPKPSVALVANAMDADTKYRLLGYIKDAKGGYTATGTGSNVALLIKSSALDGTDVYFGFPNGTLVEGAGVNLATDTQNETRQTDQMTYSPNATDTMPIGYKVYVSNQPGFDEATMLKEVFQVNAPAPTPGK